MMKLVSVVMPVYNAESFLERSIQSVLNQSYPHFELILVNDGSKDNSLKICKAKASEDSRITVFDKENAGPSDTRNYGITHCKGEFLSFIDADDEYKKDYLLDLVTAQEKQDYDLVGCNILRNTNGNYSCSSYTCDYHSQAEIHEHILGLFNSGVFNSPVNKLYKTKIIRENKILFDAEIDMGEDFAFNLDYLDYCENCNFISSENYIYHIQTESLTFKYRKNLKEERKKNIIRVEDYFNKYAIKNDFVNEMKLKLAYSCMMQEISAKQKNVTMRELKKDSFFNIHFPQNGKMKILYCIFKISPLFTFACHCMVFVKQKCKVRWKGASI